MLIAAISGLVAAITWLGKLFISDLIKQRDISQTGWIASTAATNRLAAALEARNKRDAETTRTSDGVIA